MRQSQSGSRIKAVSVTECGGGRRFSARDERTRLKPNVTIAQAHADIARMIPLIVQQFPLRGRMTREMWDDVRLAPNVRPLAEDAIGDMGRPVSRPSTGARKS